jgi:uncharacterized SAM-binding protein YcdF (DUF218 family)
MAATNTAPDGEVARPASRTGLRILVVVVILVALVWSVGFLRFVDSVARADRTDFNRADAIVVLTGGAKRLGAGFRLLSQGRGERLFVSGVNAKVQPGDLHALAVKQQESIPQEAPQCCVDLGFQAQDTRGNAIEIANWARAQGATSVLVVTSNYHMPRALAEVKNMLPDVEIRPYAVVADTVMLDSWWRWPGSLQLLIGEYHKLILASFRIFLHRG